MDFRAHSLRPSGLNLFRKFYLTKLIYIKKLFHSSKVPIFYFSEDVDLGDHPGKADTHCKITWNRMSRHDCITLVSDINHEGNGVKEVFSFSDRAFFYNSLLNSSVPDAPNWRIFVFKKRLHTTETSKNAVDSAKRSSVHFLS